MSVRVGVIGALGRVGRSMRHDRRGPADIEARRRRQGRPLERRWSESGCEVVVDFSIDVVLGDVEFTSWTTASTRWSAPPAGPPAL